MNQVACIYICHSSPAASEFILLYSDGAFEKGTLVDNSRIDAENFDYAYKKRNYLHLCSVAAIDHRGTWTENIDQGCIYFLDEGAGFTITSKYNNRYDVMRDTITGKEFKTICDSSVIEKISTMAATKRLS